MVTNLVDFFSFGAKVSCPDKVALIDGGKTFTFCEWDQRARSVAGFIASSGIPVNSIITVFLPKCAEELVVDLGVLYAGCAFSNIDCDQPVFRLKGLIDNLKPQIALVGKGQYDVAVAAGIAADSIFLIDDLFMRPPEVDETLAQRRLQVVDNDPACVINTSGSTGVPKSCVLPHRGLIDFVSWFDDRFRLGIDEVVGSLSPFHFDGYIPGLFMSLYRGATLNIIPNSLAMFPVKLAQYLADHAISFIFWVPTVMVNMANLDVLREIDLQALKTVCFAGEVFPTKHLNYWREHVRNATFVNLYGPIEISVICTYYVVDREFSDHEALPIGFPCKNTKVLILNEDDARCDDGEIGELCVSGSSLASGYWNNPERTAVSFCQNPLNANYPELIYRTGDLVYANASGELMFVGRKDFQVKHQGNRIDLSEIEHFALQVTGVRNACILYLKNRKSIKLIYEADSELAMAVLRLEMGRYLPKYMLPTEAVCLPELPRNANGKIDRVLLSTQYS